MDERLCVNCKHRDVPDYKEPCATCLPDAIRYGVRRAWQPKDDDPSSIEHTDEAR